MFWSNIVIGGIEDQVGAFFWSFWSKNYRALGFVDKYYAFLYGSPFGTSINKLWETNQPLFSVVLNGLIQFFNPTSFLHIYIIASVFLSIIFSYLFFRRLQFRKILSASLAAIFTFSPYVYIHMGIHPALSHIWLIPFFLLFFQKATTSHKLKYYLISGVPLSGVILISNYLGFFLILFTVLYFISNTIVKMFCRNYSKGFLLKDVSHYILVVLVATVLSAPFLWPYIKINYLERADTAQSKIDSLKDASRTLEDFQNFSGRPWYLILPPIQNPILGNITSRSLSWMKQDWGYFLADDYFNKESPAMYLGILNLILFSISIRWAVKNRKKREEAKNIITFSLMLFFLFSFALPPFFTLAGRSIYTPGYILYKLFPMFRVTERLGILMLLCVLVVNGNFFTFIKRRGLLIGKRKVNFNIVVAIYTVITLAEFYIPISFARIERTPDVYEYLSNTDERVEVAINGGRIRYAGPAIIAEYPYQRAQDIYYMTVHKKGLINPRGYKNEKYGFDSSDFTKRLATVEGLSTAKDLGVSYVVFHKDRLPEDKDVRVKELKNSNPEEFFRRHAILEKDFGDTILFKIK